ncbi:hypothetical protein B296_00024955 [Ensete ventricosum]|uniref:Uncharacterized protein n=1 Tax=Ensete ventricosum TaxID=4639 RepID=A0A426XQS3_ENSVE|nr:hypothetical protein B296_00024955 [Ensete ventricosum]
MRPRACTAAGAAPLGRTTRGGVFWITESQWRTFWVRGRVSRTNPPTATDDDADQAGRIPCTERSHDYETPLWDRTRACPLNSRTQPTALGLPTPRSFHYKCSLRLPNRLLSYPDVAVRCSASSSAVRRARLSPFDLSAAAPLLIHTERYRCEFRHLSLTSSCSVPVSDKILGLQSFLNQFLDRSRFQSEAVIMLLMLSTLCSSWCFCSSADWIFYGFDESVSERVENFVFPRDLFPLGLHLISVPVRVFRRAKVRLFDPFGFMLIACGEDWGYREI